MKARVARSRPSPLQEAVRTMMAVSAKKGLPPNLVLLGANVLQKLKPSLYRALRRVPEGVSVSIREVKVYGIDSAIRRAITRAKRKKAGTR